MIILLNFARCKKSILLKTSGKGIRMPFLGVITFLVHIQAFWAVTLASQVVTLINQFFKFINLLTMT